MFFDEANAALKRVPIRGGQAVDVTRLSGRLTGVSWASDETNTGQELFYRRPSDGAMMAVPIALEPTFTHGTPEVLFKTRYFDGGGHHYDVARDGRRFLMLKELESTGAAALPISLVENWFEDFRAVPPK